VSSWVIRHGIFTHPRHPLVSICGGDLIFKEKDRGNNEKVFRRGGNRREAGGLCIDCHRSSGKLCKVALSKSRNAVMHLLTAPKIAEAKSKYLDKTALIYRYTHESASSLFAALDDSKRQRGAKTSSTPRGILTDKEQDIIRAALVMCCAGLDAAIKRAITDCIEHLLEDKIVREGFEKFIARKISSESEGSRAISGAKFIAKVLSDSQPRRQLIAQYVRDLTGDSLQSADEIQKAMNALGIDPADVDFKGQELKLIFRIRNLIVHELDIDFDAPKRKRSVRSQSDTVYNCNLILSTTRNVIEAIDTKLACAHSSSTKNGKKVRI
jgi:hypothetical protein